MSKRLVIILLVLLVVGSSLFIFLYEFPKQIDLNLSAIEFDCKEETCTFYNEFKNLVDNNEGIQTKLNIKGVLKRPLFKENTFTGQIVIDHVDFTEKFNLWDLLLREINSSEGIYFSPIIYETTTEEIYLTEGGVISLSFGTIYISEDFKEFIIVYNERSNERPYDFKEEGSTKFLIAPATSDEEVMRIVEPLLPK